MTLAGYFGPWINHRAAVLVITGLDLGEYVKFLPVVQQGQLSIWREGFYLPLVTVSLSLSFWAFRNTLGRGRARPATTQRITWLLRLVMLALAVVAALNLLPPAWTPSLLLDEDEGFRLQSAVLALCLAAVAVSPLLALLPHIVPGALVVILSLASLWWPISGFLRVLPNIEALYNEPLSPGWGMYVTILGLVLLLAFTILDLQFTRSRSRAEPNRKS